VLLSLTSTRISRSRSSHMDGPPSSSSSKSLGTIALPRYVKEILALLAALQAAIWGVKSYNAATLSNEIAAAGNHDAKAQAVLSNQLMLVSMCVRRIRIWLGLLVCLSL
jgi:hypothetical protein